MSEHEPVPDGEVFYRFEKDGEQHEATSENTVIWHHIARHAIYDCVSVKLSFVWKHDEPYKELLYRALLNECERHIAVRRVHPIIQGRFLLDHFQDFGSGGYIPDEWLDEEGPSSPQE